MKIIIGLGNPGEKYEKTRHNFGFMVLDRFLGDFEPVNKTFWEEEKTVKSLIKQKTMFGQDVLFAKPQTFMNDSGKTVQLLMQKYKMKSEDVFIIHDDLDLPMGKMKVRMGGGSGGHKGVENIIETVGEKFLRIRLGIGKPTKVQSSKFKIQSLRGVEDYVLSDFASNEKGKVKTMIKSAEKIIKLLLAQGIDKYMSKYNKKT